MVRKTCLGLSRRPLTPRAALRHGEPRFEKVHQETFGKTGCRRIVSQPERVGPFSTLNPKPETLNPSSAKLSTLLQWPRPGQYLAVDPKGRHALKQPGQNASETEALQASVLGV